GATTDAHIHCCTANPLTGAAGVAAHLTDFPLGVHSGDYSHTFNLNDTATYGAAFLTAAGGTADAARDALLAGINAHEAYLNIHTNLYPGGEIRGFLVEVAAPVPEPQTYAMMLAGLAGLGVMARRRKS
ncbi:MAG: CHRD domain-containing protein, partial [Gammaproteobacteria bacterium]